MKTNTKRFAGLLLMLVMLVAMFTMMSVSASAAEPEVTAKIESTQLNLGGDLSMKYYVSASGEGVDTETLKMKFVFLGEETVVDGVYDTVIGMYVFTLEGITPQCMGDEIDAYVLFNGEEKASKLDYTVEENLNELLALNEGNALLEILVNDILAYGNAAGEYKGHESMTKDYVGTDREIPATDVINTAYLSGYTVVFGQVNYLKIRVNLAEGQRLYLDGVDVTEEIADGIYKTSGIAPTDFHKRFNFEIRTDGVFYGEFSVSVNDYIYAQRGNDAMLKLVKALYNYGISAHMYAGKHFGGAATCHSQAECEVCGILYGAREPHNYIYEADEENDTIFVTCDGGCDTSGAVTLNAPRNPSYNGERWDATVEGSTDGLVYTLSYQDDKEPINAGTYTAILLLGDKQVSVEFTIAKATPTVIYPTANTLTYNGTAQALVTPGMVDFDEVTMLYKVNDGEWVTEIPKATNAGTYTVYFKVVGNDNVKDVDEVGFTVTIAKATPEYTAPTVLTATYGQTLVDVTLSAGWEWKDGATTSVGNAGTNTFTAIFIPTDTVNFVTIEAEVTLEVAKAEINIDDLVNPEFAANLVYNGTAQELVTANGSVPGGTILYSLTYDGEYTSTIPVATEAGRYGVYWLIQGDENHEDILSPGWTQVIIAAKSGSDANITLGEYDSVYSGTAKEPDIASVVVDGVTLTKGTDYTVEYNNNILVGTATVTITFKGNYTGTATATFEITGDPATEEFDGEWVEIMY